MNRTPKIIKSDERNREAIKSKGDKISVSRATLLQLQRNAKGVLTELEKLLSEASEQAGKS